MALVDEKVFTASTGYVFKAPVGTAAPSRAALKNFNPETFGASSVKVTVTGAPTGGTFTLTHKGNATAALQYNATPAEIQAELSKLASIGAGNVVVTGEAGKNYEVAFIGKLAKANEELTATAALTGGTTPNVEVKKGAEANDWELAGHTAQEELPEFGFDGGDTKVKGSWQKKKLKEVTEEDPVDYVIIRFVQWDVETLEAYFGKNKSTTEGIYGSDGSRTSIEVAILIVMVDGPFVIAFTAAKATLRREEAIKLEADEFAILPVRATFVNHPGRLLFEWITPEA